MSLHRNLRLFIISLGQDKILLLRFNEAGHTSSIIMHAYLRSVRCINWDWNIFKRPQLSNIMYFIQCAEMIEC